MDGCTSYQEAFVPSRALVYDYNLTSSEIMSRMITISTLPFEMGLGWTYGGGVLGRGLGELGGGVGAGALPKAPRTHVLGKQLAVGRRCTRATTY